jgi:hypothetical protein
MHTYTAHIDCKDNALNITINMNLQKTDFLDITLDLETEKFFPYRKPNDIPAYVNAKSNHPPTVTRQLPAMIERRISDISSDKSEFDKAKLFYEDALTRSGYKVNLQYNEPTKKQRTRKRNVIWFNPPYNANVKTNIGREFRNLLEKHFPTHHKYRMLFNNNNAKISYRCLENMESIIKKHNARVLNPPDLNKDQPCNCRNKTSCPLEGKCRKSCIVYKATVTSDQMTKVYYGASEPEFKIRLANHVKSFNHERYEKDSTLSKHIWDLKRKQQDYNIKWSLAATASPYKGGSRRCDLCCTEKLLIVKADSETLLNSRSEIISKCRHMNKFRLKQFKT